MSEILGEGGQKRNTNQPKKAWLANFFLAGFGAYLYYDITCQYFYTQ